MSLPTLNFPSATTDSPNCQHLLDLLHPPHVKSEPGEAAPHAGSSNTAGTDRSKALARFAQVVQWGAKRQGVKRRKVSFCSSNARNYRNGRRIGEEPLISAR